MATPLQDMRILCVGKVHSNFLAVRFGEHKPQDQLPELSDEEQRQMDEELADYLEWQEDQEFWRQGQW